MKKLFLLLALVLAQAVFAADKPHIVFVTGDHEYSSERTMPILADELAKRYGFTTTVLKAFPHEETEEDIPGLEALQKADLAVFYLRWRRLVTNQLDHIEKYVKSGKPVIAFRTTTHAFNFPRSHPSAAWNSWFGTDVLGSPGGWGADGHTHFGHRSSTDAYIPPQARGNELLNGVAEQFHLRSWLYRVAPKWPPQNATVLLMGTAVMPDKQADPNPIAWTWTNKFGGKTFMTTAGHPEDYDVESFQRLLVNATHWALGQPIPKDWPGPMKFNVSYNKPPRAKEAK